LRTSLISRLDAVEAKVFSLLATSAPVLDLPPPHPTQREILEGARRFNVVCLGRRSGKTTLGIRLLLERGVRGGKVAWFSPTYKMMIDVWRQARIATRPHALRVSDVEKRIELRGGGLIEMWSMERADAVRGRSYDLAIVDEAASIAHLHEDWPMALRPTLADRAGVAWFLSTPKGLNGFWNLWQQAEGREDWSRWQMPSSCNPFLPQSEIEAMRGELPERVYRQEIEAQFIEHEGAVFRNVNECATAELQAGPIPGHVYVAGMDIGRTTDFSVVVVVDATINQVCFLDRYTGIGFGLQHERVQSVVDLFKPEVIVVETNNFGFPFIEELVARGMPVRPFKTTSQTKSYIIDKLVLAFEHRSIAIPDLREIKDELLAFAMSTSPTGMIQYSGAAGQHDDIVMALAFAWYAAEGL
jgi:hypothetical protein